MKRAAVFDVDGTLLRLVSMFDFLLYAAETGNHDEGRRFRSLLKGLTRARENDVDRAIINKAYYNGLAGLDYERLLVLSNLWYQTLPARHPAFWIELTRETLESYRLNGWRIVLISGSFVELLAPLARELGAHHVLATRLVVDARHCLTGEILPPQTVGEGKCIALAALAGAEQLNLEASVAFGDHTTDLPILTMVGDAVVVGGCATMRAEAKRRSWRVFDDGTEDEVHTPPL